MILGNHDVAVTRDPFSRAAELEGLAEVAVLLRDEATVVEHVALASSSSAPTPTVYPQSARAAVDARRPGRPTCGSSSAISPASRGAPGRGFDLVLAGHLHAGQIVLPYPGGACCSPIRASRDVAGSTRPAAASCTCRRDGTTFVPFRFCARPEVTELVLRPARVGLQQSG